MIQRHEIFHTEYYKKLPFSGSYHGMRYYIIKKTITDESETERTCFYAYIYPEPYSFAATPNEDKIEKEFEFSEDGLDRILDWLNEHFEAKQDYYRTLERNFR